ncbi:substrate-binding periplasmic protein [Oxalobacteraceae bacterium A2-2]
MRPLPALLLLFSCAALAAQPELVMVAPTDQAMPVVRFQDGVLAGGIIKDVGDLLAQRLGRRAVYVNAAPDGVTATLASGKADAMCYVMPGWIDGDYQWSAPLIPDAELIVASAAAPRLRSLKDLRGRQVGTVAGYRYPRIERVLGAHLLRADSGTMEQNLRQIAEGKVDYAIVGENTLAYRLRAEPSLKLRPDLVFAAFKTQCAFSRRARVPFADAARAIEAMARDGSVDQILARYR